MTSETRAAQNPPASVAAASAPVNGGFPEPPDGDPVRVVRTSHRACGRETRVRLPAELPTDVVRRVVCQGCAQPFEVPAVAEAEASAEAAAPPPPPASAPTSPGDRAGWLRDPRSRAWRYLSVPIAAIAVVAILLLIQGDDEPEVAFESTIPPAEEPTTPAAPADEGAPRQAQGAGSSELITESSFSLALPAGWEETEPPSGATFAAASSVGDADATLWVEENPKLAFSEFEVQSLEELEALAGSASVVERIAAPTADATIVKLAADEPEGSPAYEVTLRSSGPYRYYLSTTAQPDAAPETLEAIQLLHGSFLPTGALPEGDG